MYTILRNHFWLIVLGSLLMGSSCRNPLKLTNQGRYDEAIQVAIKRLRKAKKKHKHVIALERAFEKVTSRDMKYIETLRKDGDPANWETINAVSRQILRRQALIEPLLPLYSDIGHQAKFKFVRAEEIELESKQKASEFLYASGLQFMERARHGDLMAARNAWQKFNEINKYFQTYRDKDALIREARDLGTTNIGFQMNNNSGIILPANFERQMLAIDVRNLNDQWHAYHLNNTDPNNMQYHYSIRMNISNIIVSPESVKEREYIDSKEIEDGFEYVLDDNGNVMKDSLGNDIKVPRVKTITARVFETLQQKAANVSGFLEYYDQQGQMLKSFPVSVDAVFENYAATYRGDRRALSKESLNILGNQPVPFPPDEALLLDAAEIMKPVVKDLIVNNRNLIP